MEETKKPQPDVTLSDGTEVFFDKHRIKPKEWRLMISKDSDPEESNRLLAQFAGLEFEHVDDLSLYDIQLLFRAAYDKVLEPVVPN